MKRPIHHTFGPLGTPKHIRSALKLQVTPGIWQEGESVQQLRTVLARHFERAPSLFASGRDALLAFLTALDFRPGDEVLVQAYTCAVVPNAIIAAGGRPVYVDCDPDTLNISLDDLRKKISARSRAIICQHTFGIPGPTKDLRAMCNVHDLALIEECAHMIPDDVRSGIGKRADAVILSFGRDKALSSVSGGAVLTQHGLLADRLKDMEHAAHMPTKWEIYQWISYPLRYACAKKLWKIPVLAKAYLRGLQRIGWLPPVLTAQEKEGTMSTRLRKLPNACASLALEQWEQLGEFNAHRRKIALVYSKAAEQQEWRVPSHIWQSPAPQKFPLYHKDAAALRRTLKKQQIYLDDGWCYGPINPAGVTYTHIGYKPGSCRQAEQIAQEIVNLPTHPTMTEGQASELVKQITT